MEEKVYDSKKARRLLEELGIQPYFRGYRITLLALECISQNMECLCAVCKEIYLPIGEKLKCNTATVDAAIRRTSERAWKTNPDLVQKLCGEQLNGRPQVRYFLVSLYLACCEER